jgi:hypothetical protein
MKSKGVNPTEADMTRLKLGPLADDKPVKISIELPVGVHRDLIAYGEALGRESGSRPSIRAPGRAHAGEIHGDGSRVCQIQAWRLHFWRQSRPYGEAVAAFCGPPVTALFESVRAMLKKRRKAGLSLRNDQTALNGTLSPSIGR